MAIARSSLIGGPCKVVHNGGTFWTTGDATFGVEPETTPVEADAFGPIDESVQSAICKAGFVPFGTWQDMGKLLPAFYLNPSIGARLMGDADVAAQIWGLNGDLYTMTCAGITKPPSLYLGVDKPVWGSMELTGVVGTGKNLEDTNSLYQIQTGQAAVGTAFDPANYKKQRYTAAWGAVTGFTSFQAEEGWTIELQPKLDPVRIQGLLVDYKLSGMAIMAKCKPVGPTATQIDAALKMQGATNVQGRRLSGGGFDLAITGSGVTVTLVQAALKTAGFVFGKSALRNGEVGFVVTTKFTTGVPQALMTVA